MRRWKHTWIGGAGKALPGHVDLYLQGFEVVFKTRALGPIRRPVLPDVAVQRAELDLAEGGVVVTWNTAGRLMTVDVELDEDSASNNALDLFTRGSFALANQPDDKPLRHRWELLP